MRKQGVALGLVGVLTLGTAAPAIAGAAQDAALALGAFAVFNQIVRGETVFHGPTPPVYSPPPVVYAPPPVVYAPAPVVYAPPPPVVVYAAPPVVSYPAYGYIKRGGYWVWAPKPGHWKPGHVKGSYWAHPGPRWGHR
jgi:hypothetical protein